MPARESEALILRTYPFREADLIVSFFARDRGKLRGIARGVRRPKSRFGAGLERLAHVRLSYFQKQTVELVRIDRSELLSMPLTMRTDYAGSAGLDYMAEVAEELLPEHEPNDAYFRLLILALDDVRSRLNGATAGTGDGSLPGWFWRTLTYFSLWSVRLGGWLPPLNVCLETGAAFEANETVYFERSQYGLLSAEVKTRDSRPLSAESRAIAAEMLRVSLPRIEGDAWTGRTAADLRVFLLQRLEAHFEKRLKTVTTLAQL